jgi:hypothetical protein
MFGTVESSSKLMIEKSNYSFEQPQVAWLPIGLIFAASQHQNRQTFWAKTRLFGSL